MSESGIAIVVSPPTRCRLCACAASNRCDPTPVGLVSARRQSEWQAQVPPEPPKLAAGRCQTRGKPSIDPLDGGRRAGPSTRIEGDDDGLDRSPGGGWPERSQESQRYPSLPRSAAAR